MKQNQNYETPNNSNSPNEASEESVASKSWKKSLKATAVTSAVSLAILGVGQIPMHALLGGTETPVHAQANMRNQDDRALGEYFRRGFNYVDAKILASYWGENIGEAKVTMGYKLINLSAKDAMRFIREARGLALERSTVNSRNGYGGITFPINYRDGGYQFDDAEALSRYWKQDLGETKLLMETMLISGKDKTIKDALRNAGR